MGNRAYYIHEKWIYLDFQRFAVPMPFRRGRGMVNPTPGGRWKVRQTVRGDFRAYVDQGSNAKYARTFPRWEEALAYAQAQAYVARRFPARRGRGGFEGFKRRQKVQQILKLSSFAPSKEFVELLLKRELQDYYDSLIDY